MLELGRSLGRELSFRGVSGVLRSRLSSASGLLGVTRKPGPLILAPFEPHGKERTLRRKGEPSRVMTENGRRFRYFFATHFDEFNFLGASDRMKRN